MVNSGQLMSNYAILLEAKALARKLPPIPPYDVNEKTAKKPFPNC